MSHFFFSVYHISPAYGSSCLSNGCGGRRWFIPAAAAPYRRLTIDVGDGEMRRPRNLVDVVRMSVLPVRLDFGLDLDLDVHIETGRVMDRDVRRGGVAVGEYGGLESEERSPPPPPPAGENES